MVELDAVAVPAALSALLRLVEIPEATAVLLMGAEESFAVGEGETRVGAITRFKTADLGTASAAVAAVAAAAVDCGAPRVDNDDLGGDIGAGIDKDIDDTVEAAGVAIVLAEVARDRNGKTETDCSKAD